ncbi:MAG: hypothetical protein RL154_673 [Pseudomonadota bacterium]|jgi:ADP-heptose:LPS heptosyltransferase
MNLVNKFYEQRSFKALLDSKITQNDLQNSQKIVFSMFNRYGELFACIKIILELLEKYAQKELMFIIPSHFEPYIKYFFPFAKIVIVFKRNPFQVINAILAVKKFAPDIGFNPWSYGSESEFFISYAEKFYFYVNYMDSTQTVACTDNFYDQLRSYLALDSKLINRTWSYQKLEYQKSYRKILLCPESSSTKTRCIPNDTMKKLCLDLVTLFSPEELIVASVENLKPYGVTNNFIMKKSRQSSSEFLKLMQSVDLVVTVDAGPLHLAHLLNIDTICLFTVTPPQSVLDIGSKCRILREPLFGKRQCKNHNNCERPICMDKIIDIDFIKSYQYDDAIPICEIEIMCEEECIYK